MNLPVKKCTDPTSGPPSTPAHGSEEQGKVRRKREGKRAGAAMIVALWVIIILSLLISAFAYSMHVEAKITSYYRKRIKAQYVARAGVEWAKHVLSKSYEVSEDEEEGDENILIPAINLSRGVGFSGRKIEVGEGFCTIDILPEHGRYNVNILDDLQWEELLDYANVPEDRWDELIDCFNDWIDENDEHALNGAESDDSFYEERDYKVKNAPLDTVSELRMIKGFDQSVVYGGPGEDEDDPPIQGIAGSLTVWGDGKINVNTASRNVLMTLPGVDEVVVEGILEQRAGEDGELGTRDDGFDSVQDLLNIPGIDAAAIQDRITTTERKYVRVISIGEVNGVKSGIWAVLLGEQGKVVPLYWREESMQ